MRRFFLGCVFVGGLGVVGVSSCGDDASGEQLCEPGSNVFCRCRGTRDAGTKQCNEAGDGFGACETAFGECEEIEDPTSPSSGPGNPTGAGGMPDPPKPGELYAACDEDAGKLCNAGLECSAMGFCTKACESYEECTAAGDCLVIGANQRCVPYCTEQSDCKVFSDLATCGYTEDVVPTYGVVVCSQWGNDLELPPDGYPTGFECDNDAICNLGFGGVARVCSATGCTDGCRSPEDCPGMDSTCSSDGTTVGTCGGTTGEDVDKCPGVTVALSTSMPNVQRTGNTSQAPPPSESEGTGNCESLGPTEEDVYRVTVANGGTLIVNVDSTAGYDPILYVRDGSCESGTQFECSDASGAGQGEIVEFPVFDDDEIWVFVDGFYGSTGSYTIEFDLTPN